MNYVAIGENNGITKMPPKWWHFCFGESLK